MSAAFGLVRAALDDDAPSLRLEAQEWWSLFRLMQQSHVAALTAEAMARMAVPRDVKVPWLAEREKVAKWHRYQQEVQADIIGHMERHGIRTLVLKGNHTARHYPNPELRSFGDLDLYFYDRHKEADEVARKELKASVSNDAHHHSKYNYRGVTVESHYDFLNVHYPPSNRRYEALLKAQCPSATFEVLFLLRHMACHFAASRLTLRDLVDWTLTCRALEDAVDWNVVQQTVDSHGMKPFVAALNSIAEKQLEISLPLQRGNGSDMPADMALIERDLVYGSPAADDHKADGLPRLGWKLRRWRALAWKRRLVYSDSEPRLLLASLTSHARKPQGILHKM